MAAAPPSPAQVRSLLRAFLREGRKFPNYNIKEYVQRRAREDFRSHASETDPATLAKWWSLATEELAGLRRQSAVYGLYGSRQKNVLELDSQKRSFRTFASP